jgi:cytochrome b561
VLVFTLVLSRELIDEKVSQLLLLQVHRAVGLIVWVFAISRLMLRIRLPLADSKAGLPWPQRFASLATQVLLYACLLSLPVLGWLLTNARGQVVDLPLLRDLPVLLDRDLDLADDLESWHSTLAWVMVGLVGLHGAAAVWHHRIRRDGVLMAMWPGLRRRR